MMLEAGKLYWQRLCWHGSRHEALPFFILKIEKIKENEYEIYYLQKNAIRY